MYDDPEVGWNVFRTYLRRYSTELWLWQQFGTHYRWQWLFKGRVTILNHE